MEASYTVSYGSRTGGFSRREVRELALSTLVLTLAFSIAFMEGIQEIISAPGGLIYILPMSFVAVLTGYLLHELAHKWVAQRYGLWAEFRYWLFGLVLALATSLFGLVFAAPGAVYIAGHATRERMGRVAAAGPMVNIIIGAALLPLTFMTPLYLSWILRLVAMINIFLGGFNLLPIPPLDGSKVLFWSKAVWAAMIIAVVGLYILSMQSSVFTWL
ncbi:MAG: site-2 protease family protein [Candidatus Thermoplasmatota archaeon]